MDCPVEERWSSFNSFELRTKLTLADIALARSEFPVLGELGAGNAGRAVHGGR